MNMEQCVQALQAKAGWTPPQREVTTQTFPDGSRATEDERGTVRFYDAPGAVRAPDQDRLVLTLRLENPIIKDGFPGWSATEEFMETLREYIAAVEAGHAHPVFEGPRGTRLTAAIEVNDGAMAP